VKRREEKKREGIEQKSRRNRASKGENYRKRIPAFAGDRQTGIILKKV